MNARRVVVLCLVALALIATSLATAWVNGCASIANDTLTHCGSPR